MTIDRRSWLTTMTTLSLGNDTDDYTGGEHPTSSLQLDPDPFTSVTHLPSRTSTNCVRDEVTSEFGKLQTGR